jgi:receptor protein-tyrosine kinase
MSLIEQAAKRLEELRRAGVELPDAASAMSDGSAALAAPTPEAVVRALESATPTMTHERVARVAPRIEPPTPGREHVRVDIDLLRLKELGYLTPESPKSQIADEFRVIKRPVIRNALGLNGVKVRNGNLVMVTSALPGEGKTFTAVNLAMSVALEYDNTVLLVDGDVAHPALPDLLGVSHAPGLLDLLTGDDVDVGDALVKTNVEKLSILPAGSRHRRATELLASEQMASLLHELASRYPDRIIIFDSPPLLATTEARVLATHMGQIVMVVAADSTSQQQVNQALATIESCEIVLMMLNKASRTDVGAYYGYYVDEPAR